MLGAKPNLHLDEQTEYNLLTTMFTVCAWLALLNKDTTGLHVGWPKVVQGHGI